MGLIDMIGDVRCEGVVVLVSMLLKWNCLVVDIEAVNSGRYCTLCMYPSPTPTFRAARHLVKNYQSYCKRRCSQYRAISTLTNC